MALNGEAAMPRELQALRTGRARLAQQVRSRLHAQEVQGVLIEQLPHASPAQRGINDDPRPEMSLWQPRVAQHTEIATNYAHLINRHRCVAHPPRHNALQSRTKSLHARRLWIDCVDQFDDYQKTLTNSSNASMLEA